MLHSVRNVYLARVGFVELSKQYDNIPSYCKPALGSGVTASGKPFLSLYDTVEGSYSRTEGEMICDKFHTISSCVAENEKFDRSVARITSTTKRSEHEFTQKKR